MKTNVEKVLERDQKLSELDDRADALQQGASQFEQQAGKLKRKFWLQNLKMMIIMGVIGLVFVAIIACKYFQLNCLISWYASRKRTRILIHFLLSNLYHSHCSQIGNVWFAATTTTVCICTTTTATKSTTNSAARPRRWPSEIIGRSSLSSTEFKFQILKLTWIECVCVRDLRWWVFFLYPLIRFVQNKKDENN